MLRSWCLILRLKNGYFWENQKSGEQGRSRSFSFQSANDKCCPTSSRRRFLITATHSTLQSATTGWYSWQGGVLKGLCARNGEIKYFRIQLLSVQTDFPFCLHAFIAVHSIWMGAKFRQIILIQSGIKDIGSDITLVIVETKRKLLLENENANNLALFYVKFER